MFLTRPQYFFLGIGSDSEITIRPEVFTAQLLIFLLVHSILKDCMSYRFAPKYFKERCISVCIRPFP
jgi:hypothetical protein